MLHSSSGLSHHIISSTLALVLISNLITLITSSSTDFIKSSCGSTMYPDLCFTTLSIFASKIQTSPRLLAMASLSEALKAARSASTAISRLSESRGLTEREAEALTDCAEELTDSADELHRSIAEMARHGQFRLRMSNIQTWVSAALTDEDTCVDGFSGKNGNVEKAVTKHIIKVAHMTSNALALVNHFAE